MKTPPLHIAVSNPRPPKAPSLALAPAPIAAAPARPQRSAAPEGEDGSGRLAAARAAADQGDLATAERLAAEAIAILPASAEPRCLAAQILLALRKRPTSSSARSSSSGPPSRRIWG
jgi:hypothetical protein